MENNQNDVSFFLLINLAGFLHLLSFEESLAKNLNKKFLLSHNYLITIILKDLYVF